MHPLERKIEKLITARNLLTQGERVLVAVSGGPDSVALLRVLAALAPGWDLWLGVAHLNHGLRPVEGEREEALVRSLADRLGLEYRTDTRPVRQVAREGRLSLEHAARLVRYAFLEEVAGEVRAQKIALAHTADDQAEEVLLRLIRGTGRAGLSGMRLLREGRIVRPLLETPKAEILSYLADQRLTYLEDSSNRDRHFLRNRIRLELLPRLAECYNPNIRETLRRTAAIFQEEERLLSEMAEAACREILQLRQRDGLPEASLRLPELRRQPLALQRRVLEAVCWRLGQEPSFRQIDQLLHLTRAEAERQLHLADGLRVQKTGERLFFRYPAGKSRRRGDLQSDSPTSFEVRVPGPGSYMLPLADRKLICILEAAAMPPDLTEKGSDLLDSNVLSFPLVLRSPRPGDRFHPLGAPGRKKVGDFLTDRKIPSRERRQVVVLETADHRIAALVGLRIDQRFRVTKATREVLRVRLQTETP